VNYRDILAFERKSFGSRHRRRCVIHDVFTHVICATDAHPVRKKGRWKIRPMTTNVDIGRAWKSDKHIVINRLSVVRLILRHLSYLTARLASPTSTNTSHSTDACHPQLLPQSKRSHQLDHVLKSVDFSQLKKLRTGFYDILYED